MKNIIIGLILSSLFFSCSKQEPNVLEETIIASFSPAPIGFDDLVIGDEFNYLLFLAESFYDPENPNFSYTPDTLNVEVCGFRDGKFVVSEKITEGSAMFDAENQYYYFFPDSTFTNYWQVRNDSLVISQKEGEQFYSHLFHGTPRSLNLMEFQENEVEMYGWKTTYPYTVDYIQAHVINGEIGGYTYPFLNVLMNNTAMALDGDGLMQIYNREDGIISSSIYDGWITRGIGWEIIIE